MKSLLTKHSLLNGLDISYLELLNACSQSVRFEAGRFIFREGEPANRFYLMREGRVGIELFSPKKGPITIEVVKEGSVLGWSWLISPHKWHYDAHVIEDVRAIEIDTRSLRNKFEEDPSFGYEMTTRFLKVVVQRIQSLSLQLLGLYTQP